MILYYRLLILISFAAVLCTCSCSKKSSEGKRTSEAPDLIYANSEFCHDLAQTCPKLAALAAAYPPKREAIGIGHIIHAELLNYLLDSVATFQNYFKDLPGPCPGITRAQIHCAIGLPYDSLGVYKPKDELLLGDFYSYARDPEYGLEPTKFWTKAGYIPIFFIIAGIR